jgi:hypothetical protein
VNDSGFLTSAVAELEARLASPCPCHDRDRHLPPWHRSKGPAPALRTRHGLTNGALPRWVDHDYRERRDDGTWRYVCEPYWLHEDALADLASLAELGWHVTVSATRARHFPGHTVAVEIEQPEEGAST